MRVTAQAPDPTGGWDAILVSSEGEGWWYWYGLDPSTVASNLANHGTRLIDLSPYWSGSVLQYAVVELDDSNPPQDPINAASTSVQAYQEANGWAGGYHGSYFISSAPGANPIIAENSNFRFEPASTIEVLYLLYTLQQNVNLSDPIVYYWTDNNPPNPNACPLNVLELPSNAHVTTIGNALTQMIQSSNNIYARAFAIKWGTGPVQAMANALGMTSTHLNQPDIGCAFRGAVRNELTLTDAARLYSAVDNGSALTGSARDTFFNILVGGTPSSTGVWGQVVAQEAAKQGKSAIVPQDREEQPVEAHQARQYRAGAAVGGAAGDSDAVARAFMHVADALEREVADVRRRHRQAFGPAPQPAIGVREREVAHDHGGQVRQPVADRVERAAAGELQVARIPERAGRDHQLAHQAVRPPPPGDQAGREERHPGRGPDEEGRHRAVVSGQ